MRIGIVMSLVVGLAMAACGTEGAEGREAAGLPAATARPTPAIVDSALPISVALERFRADIRPAPVALSGGKDSPEALAATVVRLLAASDTLGFAPITVDRGEFAWLYYESTPESRPPYELPPGLLWFQLQQGNRSGLFRLMRELGSKPLRYQALVCEDPPRELGENRLRAGCRVRFSIEGESGVRELRLFSLMLEREGRVKLLSVANDF